VLVAQDDSIGGTLFTVGVTEAVFADAVATAVRILLWQQVDDSQTQNWQNVNNTQNPAWTQVADTQSPNWQNVNNTQNPAWTQVADTQSPNWQQIVI